MRASRLLALLLSASMATAAAAQCSRVPRADAGDDVQACIGAVGTTDFALSAARSVSQPLNGPIVQYCWSTDYGGFLPTGNDTACFTDTEVTLRIPNTPGRTLVHVTLTVTDASGCSGQDQMTLDLATPPVITRADASATSICFGQQLDLLASAVNTFDTQGLVTYRWDLDTSLDTDRNGFAADDADTTLTGVSGHLVVTTTTPTRMGHYTARLLATTLGDRCSAIADVDYDVLPPPIVRLVVGPASTCPNVSGDFQAELAFGDTRSDLTWDFDTSVDSDGNGNPADDVEASGARVTHAYTDSGTLRLRVTALGLNGCQGYTEKDIVVLPAPVPAFTTAGPSCSLLAVSFTDRSEGTPPLSVAWSFGDGSAIEDGVQRTHLFPSPGTYLVSHYVTDDNGCTSSETRSIDVVPQAATIAGVTLFDGQPGTGTTGNANGFAEPGERVRFEVTVANEGAGSSGELVATLTSLESEGLLSVVDGSATLFDVQPGGTAITEAPDLSADILARTPCGSRLPAQIRVASAGSSTCATAVTIPVRVGIPSLVRQGSEQELTASPGTDVPVDATFAGGAHAIMVLDSSGPSPRARLVRVSTTGQHLAGDVIVDQQIGEARAPRVAWSEPASQIGAAWIETQPSAPGIGNVGAFFRRLDAGAHAIGVAHRLDLFGHVGTIDLAWSGDHWLVTYTDRDTVQSTAQLWAQAITKDGLLLGTPVPLGVPVSDDGVVSLASGGDRVLVAHRTGSELRLFVVQGLTPTVASQRTLDTASGEPAAAPFGAGFLVAFESGSGIDLAWLSGSGALTRTIATDTGIHPALTTGPETSAVAWEQSGEIWARVIGATGKAGGSPVLVTTGPYASLEPQLSTAADGIILATWASHDDPGVVLTRGVFVAPGLPEGCETGVLGDVAPAPGGDGRVDIGDVVLVLRAAVDLTPVTDSILERGDVAPGERIGSEHQVIGDDTIDVADAVVLLQASTGLITLTP